MTEGDKFHRMSARNRIKYESASTARAMLEPIEERLARLEKIVASMQLQSCSCGPQV